MIMKADCSKQSADPFRCIRNLEETRILPDVEMLFTVLRMAVDNSAA